MRYPSVRVLTRLFGTNVEVPLPLSVIGMSVNGETVGLMDNSLSFMEVATYMMVDTNMVNGTVKELSLLRMVTGIRVNGEMASF